MYAGLWRALPGPVVVKAVVMLLLLLAVVVVCFEWFFPLVESWLPFSENTVSTDTGTTALLPQLVSHREDLR
ncbi:MAG: hypothetical protein ABIP45_02490 [Knoellia sp.]